MNFIYNNLLIFHWFISFLNPKWTMQFKSDLKYSTKIMKIDQQG